MGKPSFSQIQQELNAADLSALPRLPVAVLRNVTVEAIEPYLRHGALTLGLNAEVRFGEFDNAVQEALSGELIGEDTAVVLVVLQLETLAPALGRGFAALDAAGVAAEVERVQTLVSTIVGAIRRRSAAMILWHSFESPLHPSLGIVDVNRTGGQSDTVAALNRFTRDELAAAGNAYLVDLERCRARVGEAEFYDARYWHIGRAPWSRRGLEQIAEEQLKFVRALRGKSRKVLVLDCDNVLWGGIVGEDGLAGIRLSRTHPGSPFLELQQVALSLFHRGVVLALCSKNNEADVWQVFEQHPDMLLRREHIAAWRIDWRDKATNLRELAAELNLGLDSFVFADDSEFEIGLVRQMLPEVLALHLPVERAVEHAGRLAALGVFDTLTLSEEDRGRGAMYRAEAERRRLQTKITDLDDYYRSLEMRLTIRLVDELSRPRVAQLTQKTNQFNLTTRRYSEEDIRRFGADGDHDVVTLRLADRFGDSGLVGVCILAYEGQRAVLDTLLMSCRVLGREVERAFLACCLARARARGCASAVGLFAPTAKNGLAAGFYEKHGFRREGEERGAQRFLFDLTGAIPAPPPLFQSIDSDLETRPAEGRGGDG